LVLHWRHTAEAPMTVKLEIFTDYV